MNKTRKIFLYFLLSIFLSGCGRSLLFKETRIAMDTFVEISCVSSNKEIALSAMKDAFKEIERIEGLLSRYNEASEVSKINQLAGIEAVEVDSEVLKIIERSIYYSRLSKGSFDITVAPLVTIWGLARKNNSIPDPEVVKATLEYTGYKNILMDKETLSVRFLHKDTKIDLGGIAKGYAVDRAKEILLSRGIKNALINIGGNIFAIGSPVNKDSWQIGVQDPRDRNDIVYRLNLKNKAVATSGDYERFFILNGKRFSHIIDPANGRPAEGIIAVTVVADSAEKADVLSTAIFVMGVENALSLVESLRGVEVFIFDKDGDLIRHP